MKKIIFALNSNKSDLSFLIKEEGWEKQEIESLSSIDYNLIKESKAIILICGQDKRRVKDLFASYELRSCNLPTLFLLEEECPQLIQLCYKNDFPQIFLRTKKQLLLKAHIKYIFDNYEMAVRNHGQRWLKDVDPNSFTKKEFQIIEYIAQAPLTELSREELQTFIWGDTKNTTNKLDVHICNLRKKLNEHHMVLQTNEKGKVSLGMSDPSHFNKKVGV